FYKIRSYLDSNDYYLESTYSLAHKYLDEKNIDKAMEFFSKVNDYKDSKQIYIQIKFDNAKAKYLVGDFTTAKILFKEIPENPDAKTFLAKIEALQSLQGTWLDNVLGTVKYVIDGWKL